VQKVAAGDALDVPSLPRQNSTRPGCSLVTSQYLKILVGKGFGTSFQFAVSVALVVVGNRNRSRQR